MTFSRQDWVDTKVATALHLANGKCGGSYAEGVIILSAVISAIAAEAWPGRFMDKKRFVELVNTYCTDDIKPTQVSIPLLIGFLREKEKYGEADVIRKNFMNYQKTRVLTSEDVDHSETEVLSICPGLSLGEIRRFSYSSVFYDEVRSGFVHEYRPGKKADSYPIASAQDDQISYGNWVDDPDRHIYFPMQWVINIAKSVAKTADSNADQFPLGQPQKWWVEG